MYRRGINSGGITDSGKQSYQPADQLCDSLMTVREKQLTYRM